MTLLTEQNCGESATSLSKTAFFLKVRRTELPSKGAFEGSGGGFGMEYDSSPISYSVGGGISLPVGVCCRIQILSFSLVWVSLGGMSTYSNGRERVKTMILAPPSHSNLQPPHFERKEKRKKKQEKRRRRRSHTSN